MALNKCGNLENLRKMKDAPAAAKRDNWWVCPHTADCWLLGRGWIIPDVSISRLLLASLIRWSMFSLIFALIGLVDWLSSHWLAVFWLIVSDLDHSWSSRSIWNREAHNRNWVLGSLIKNGICVLLNIGTLFEKAAGSKGFGRGTSHFGFSSCLGRVAFYQKLSESAKVLWKLLRRFKWKCKATSCQNWCYQPCPRKLSNWPNNNCKTMCKFVLCWEIGKHIFLFYNGVL